MDRITPCLWFDTEAEEAAQFYTSVFPRSRVVRVTHYGSAGPRPEGLVMEVEFELDGRSFLALNGGPQFRFTDAISLQADCEDQAEVDRLWDALLANGGKADQCGWLKDRYGVSWQIVPTALVKYLGGADKAGAQRAMQAMLGMVKLDIEGLKRAYEGKSAA